MPKTAPDQYDSDRQYGLGDFAQVEECCSTHNKRQHQYQCPNASRCRAVELIRGDEVGLHVLEFD
ncbi:hypothetical protein [Bradyrhizobium japonicum]|uniref:hypothetical protein n=1 Tax=Bradyrhizobium japonicum TaxID=375 RepID=UPI001364D0AF|nr:hypothetical protein [Bradyrhizobium japonicum]